MQIRYFLSNLLVLLTITTSCKSKSSAWQDVMAQNESAKACAKLRPQIHDDGTTYVRDDMRQIAACVAAHARAAAYFYEYEFEQGHIRPGKFLYQEDVSSSLQALSGELVRTMQYRDVDTAFHFYTVSPYMAAMAQELVDQFHETGRFPPSLVEAFVAISVSYDERFGQHLANLQMATQAVADSGKPIDGLLEGEALGSVWHAAFGDQFDCTDIAYVREYNPGTDYAKDRRKQRWGLGLELVRVKKLLIYLEASSCQFADLASFLEAGRNQLRKSADSIAKVPESDYQSNPEWLLDYLQHLIKRGKDERTWKAYAAEQWWNLGRYLDNVYEQNSRRATEGLS